MTAIRFWHLWAGHGKRNQTLRNETLPNESERIRTKPNVSERNRRIRLDAATAAEATVARVREAARGSENLLPPLRDALAAHCTVGELCETLREEFGMYDAQRTP